MLETLNLDLIYIAGGLAALVLGGELLVRSAVQLARALGVSALVIGLTLVGFGTSTPELLTSVQAAWSGSPGIALGNVIGSNIGNILLIAGLAALISPILVSRKVLARDGLVMVTATVVCAALVFWGAIPRWAGFGLVSSLVAYLVFTLVTEHRNASETAKVYEAEATLVPANPMRLGRAGLGLVAGLFITLLGARLLVAGAVGLAQWLGYSEAVIGLTVVAIGTSMPELVTSVLAARKGQSDVAFGNIIGSNIFNLLGILGVTAIMFPFASPMQISHVDLLVLIGATVAFVIFAFTGARLGRREGLALFLAYCGYLAWLIATA